MCRRLTRAGIRLLLLGLASLAFAGQTDGRIATEASLRPAPDSQALSALLTRGAPVEVLERRGDWVQVRLEGWVPASAVEAGARTSPVAESPKDGAETETDPRVAEAQAAQRIAEAQAAQRIAEAEAAQRIAEAEAAQRIAEAQAAQRAAEARALPRATPPASASRPTATAGAAGGFPVEGLLSIKTGKKKKKELSTAGASLWLLPEEVDLSQRDADGESDKRLAELDAEAARLAREASDALKKIDNFTEATRRRDELKRERAAVLSERRDLLAVRNGRHEQIARDHAIATSLADTRGWFSFSAVPPGSYKIYGRLTRDDVDVEWIEGISVGNAAVRIDLDESMARGL